MPAAAISVTLLPLFLRLIRAELIQVMHSNRVYGHHTLAHLVAIRFT